MTDLNPADLVIALREWLGNFILRIVGIFLKEHLIELINS